MSQENKHCLLALDDLCTRFDRQWTEKIRIAEIHSLVDQFPFADAKSELFVELVCIDLQKRWAVWVHDLIEMGEHNPETLRALVRDIPTFHDYLSNIEDLICICQEKLEEIKQTEFRIRHANGDAPPPEQIWQEQFPKEFVSNCQNQLLIELLVNNKLQLKQSSWGEIVLGRQSDSNSMDRSLKKIVCAAASNRDVSRNQVRIKTISNSYTIVSNVSQSTKFMLNSNFYLRPGESEIIRFPFCIDLSNIQIKVSRTNGS